MDNRLKEIANNLDKLKIGPDDTFSFGCTMCGKCCINREDILINPKDVYNIARKLDITPTDVLKEYCDAYIGEDSRMPIVRLQPRGIVKRCPFLKELKCSIHEAKPTLCATFPIGRCLVNDADKPEGFKPEDIIYILTDPRCGDKSEKHTVREWLESFNILLDDEFFIKWQDTIISTSDVLRNLEKMMVPETMQTIWDIALLTLYVDYTTKEEFMPQFERNREKLSVQLGELMGMVNDER